ALQNFDAGTEQRLVEPERRELAHRMGQQRDADAELLHLGRALVDAARDAVAMQVERKRKAGDAAADDRNFHDGGAQPRPGWVITLSSAGVPERTASSPRLSAGRRSDGFSTFSPWPPHVSITFS